MGYIIDKDGLHKSPNKIKAIKDAPLPKNKTEVKAFLGMINYYHRFVPNMPNLARPLYNLLKNNVKFKWNSDCQNSFIKIKQVMCSDDVLVHYNPDLKLNLYVDASPFGLGACLTHTYDDGSERPIVYASRTLSVAKQKYSRIDKEALAIYFGVKKFHQYVYGRQFTLYSDNKPLVAIFEPKKGVPVYAANRLQRYALFLNNYTFDIKYIKSEKNQADWFSRSPVGNSELCVKSTTYLNFFSAENELNLNIDSLKKTVKSDKEYCKVLKYVEKGWYM